MKNFLNDESGVIISAELVLVLTICVLGAIVGLSHLAMSVNAELEDIAQAIGALDQSYSFAGYTCCEIGHVASSATAGSKFTDAADHCDCNTSCDMVVPVPTATEKTGG